MPENHPSETVATPEGQVLRALCAGTGAPNDWNQLASQLSGHCWQDPDHQVMYEALRAIKSCEPKARREELPAQVTRMGFPDLDCSTYFEGEELPVVEIEEIIRRLKAASLDRS
jgi:hypothetical protein